MTQAIHEAVDPSFGITGKQIDVLSPRIRLVEAGPGAGKTRSIVARFRTQARVASHGVALLSFTNAAVEEATRRCAVEPTLLAPPHFVGTFDQFFHRYVVTPYVISTHNTVPTYIASWDELPGHLARVRPTSGGLGIRLSAFRIQVDGKLTLDGASLSHAEVRFLEGPQRPDRGWLERQATNIRDRILSKHIYDSQSARKLALRILQTDLAAKPLKLLARRFGEVIVDEFQDCDNTEHSLLQLLDEAGVAVIAVADPDQAIYEFRQESKDDLYAGYRAKLSSDQIVELDVCYRSTKAICSMVSSLRHIGQSQINAGEDRRDNPEKNYVVVGSGQELKNTAIRISQLHGISTENLRILSHATSDARKLSSGGIEPPNGASQTERILTSLVSVRTSSTPRLRLSAIHRLERSFLDLLQWPDNVLSGNRRAELEFLGLAETQLRIMITQLVESSADWKTPDQCGKGLREFINGQFGALPIPLVPRLGSLLKRPQDNLWNYWTKSVEENVSRDGDAIGWSNIHGVKGAEFEAVLLALPQRTRPGSAHVLDDWQTNTSSEQRRVLYVGASRARKLLMLGVGKKYATQLLSILDRDSVPYERIDAT